MCIDVERKFHEAYWLQRKASSDCQLQGFQAHYWCPESEFDNASRSQRVTAGANGAVPPAESWTRRRDSVYNDRFASITNASDKVDTTTNLASNVLRSYCFWLVCDRGSHDQRHW